MKYDGPLDVIVKDDKLTDQNQYTYIGSISEKGRVRKFIFHCTVCAQDKELFGDALFHTSKYDLKRGQLFCGCSKSGVWNLQQAEIKSRRAANEAGHIFNGIVLPFKGAASRCNLSCTVCNHMWTSKLSNLWALKRGCIKCRNTKGIGAAIKANIKPESVIIKSFMDTNSYHSETVFTKIERKARNSRNNYWSVYCPVCKTTSESQQGHLQRGKVPCACSNTHQKETYINLLKEDQQNIAIKFGISKDSNKRLLSHNYNTPDDIELFAVFKYQDSFNCKAAERACKQELLCGVVEKSMFLGGWTETTYSYNLDRIIEIFQEYGGIRVL